MRGSFTKGMIFGSIVGASLSMIMDNGDMNKKRRKMMKNGRSFIRNSGYMINDIVRMFK